MISKHIRSMTAVLTILFISSAAFAQRGMLGIHAGFIKPNDIKSGLSVGGTWGTSVDEAVDIGIGFDVFHRSYQEETQVAKYTSDDIKSETIVTELEYSRTVIPIMAEINVKVPMGRYMGYLLRGNLGYAFLWSKEKNYEEGTNETRNFNGWCWQAGAGIYYEIGSRSTLTGDIFYNNSKVSRKVENTTAGLPMSERVDLSGFGVRLGVLLQVR